MIAFNGSGINCVVRNISADGAALEVESQAGIPSEFGLVIATEQFSGFCRVLWRKAKRLGVAFQPEDPTNAMPPLAPVLTPAPKYSANRAKGPVNGPLDEPSPSHIRNEDTLPEHPGPPIAPDLPD